MNDRASTRALARGRRFKLVQRGLPLVKIFVGKQAPPPVAFAAEELQRYVREMSGAEIPILRGSARTHQLVLSSGPDGIRERTEANKSIHSSPDSYEIHVTSSVLVVAGTRAAAVLYGVYDLLERLGCGFCVPGEDTVPRNKNLALAPGIIEARPVFTYRGHLDFPLGPLRRSLVLIDWLAKNRFNWYHPAPNAIGLPRRRGGSRAPRALASVPGRDPDTWTLRRDAVAAEITKRGLHVQFGGHTMATWLPPDHAARHPEWFATVNGKRGGTAHKQREALCISNRSMRRQLLLNLRRFLDDFPEVEIVDLWHPDSNTYCHCRQCLRGVRAADAEAAGMAYLRTFIEFANALVRALRKTHPGVQVSPLVNYSLSTNWPLPQGIEIDDGLLIGLAHFPPLRDSYLPMAGEPKSAGNQRLLAIDLSWACQSRHTYIYEYFHGWYTPYIHPQALLAERELRLFSRLGFTGLSSDMYGWTPVNIYVSARLMWDPGLSAAALVRDFCERYYGEASESMYEYWMDLEAAVIGMPGYLSGGPINAWARKAERPQIVRLNQIAGCVADPAIRERIERCTIPWRFLGEKERPRWWAVPVFNPEATAAS